MQTALGILYTFLGAFLQSSSYFFAAYGLRHHKEADTFDVLCRSFIFMGGMAVVSLGVLWHPIIVDAFPRYWYFVIGMAVTQVLGQWVFFVGQKSYDASRMVPLLGLKLVFLALVNQYVLSKACYGWIHWLAIAITIMAACMLNKSGTSLPMMALMIVLVTCLIYTGTDNFIQSILDIMKTGEGIGVVRASMLGASVCYIALGIGMLPMLLLRKKQPASLWWPSIGNGFAWYAAMLFLYSGYGTIGIVSGNIILNTRGLISIIFGAILAKLGMTELEEKVPFPVFIKRCVAALLMLLAIYLFNSRAA